MVALVNRRYARLGTPGAPQLARTELPILELKGGAAYSALIGSWLRSGEIFSLCGRLAKVTSP
jgi:hypothetical protein